MIYLKKFSLFAEIKVSVWFQVLRLKDTRFVLVSVLFKQEYSNNLLNKLYHNFKVNKLLYIKINVLLDIFIKILFSTSFYFHPCIFLFTLIDCST